MNGEVQRMRGIRIKVDGCGTGGIENKNKDKNLEALLILIENVGILIAVAHHWTSPGKYLPGFFNGNDSGDMGMTWGIGWRSIQRSPLQRVDWSYGYTGARTIQTNRCHSCEARKARVELE